MYITLSPEECQPHEQCNSNPNGRARENIALFMLARPKWADFKRLGKTADLKRDLYQTDVHRPSLSLLAPVIWPLISFSVSL